MASLVEDLRRVMISPSISPGRPEDVHRDLFGSMKPTPQPSGRLAKKSTDPRALHQ